MTDEPDIVPKNMAERDFKQIPRLKDVFVIGEAIDKETDRGKVVMLGSFLDDILKEMLLAFLIDSTNSVRIVADPGGLLWNFGARIQVAYSLGLISKNEFTELGVVQSIRNRFAHDMLASFDDKKIVGYVSKLRFYVKSTDGKPMSSAEIFVSATSVLIFWLVGRPANIKPSKRQRLQDTLKEA